MATIAGWPQVAASSVATASLRADSGAITSDPSSSVSSHSPSAAGDRHAGDRRDPLEPGLDGEHGADEIADTGCARRRRRSRIRRIAGISVDSVHGTHDGALGGAGVTVKVGVDDRPDDQRSVERLAIGGERQHHRPCAGADAAQPDAAHLDQVLANVAPPGDEPAVGVRRRRLDIRSSNLPSARHGDTIGELTGELRNALTGLGEEMEDTHLGEHLVVPVRFGADVAGEPAYPVGERPGAGIGESPGHLVPGGEAGDRRVGESGTQAIFEPPVELDEPADELLDAFVAAALGAVGWSPGPIVNFLAGAGPTCCLPVRERGRRLTLGGPRRHRLAIPAALLPLGPGADRRRLGNGADVAAQPQHEQGDDVLAGIDTARAGAPRANGGVVDGGIVRLRTGAVIAPPDGALAAPGP